MNKGERVEFVRDVVMGNRQWTIPKGTTATIASTEPHFTLILDGEGWPDNPQCVYVSRTPGVDVEPHKEA